MGRPMLTRIAAFLFVLLRAVFPAAEEVAAKPRVYADPRGRFSFQLSGDWIKIATSDKEGVAGSFVLARKIGSDRSIAAELFVSFAEPEPTVSLDEYVKTEDRRVTNTPGFKKRGDPEKTTLAGSPALKISYILSRQDSPGQQPPKLVRQYYVQKDKQVWGITLSALQQDESLLAEVERTVVASFQFSVPEGAAAPPLQVFKKVLVSGPRGGFSLAVPEAWQVSQNDEQGASVRGPDAVVYAFSLAHDDERISVQDIAGQFLKERENLTGLQVLSQRAPEAAGLGGFVVEYLGVGEGRRWHVRLVAVAQSQKVFFVYCVAAEEAWERNKNVLGQIEQSFSLASPSPKPEAKE